MALGLTQPCWPCLMSNLFAALPREILMYIFRWVVSSDLDLRALEQLSLVCRGFYICARSAPPPTMWQHITSALFGFNLGALILPGTRRFGIQPVQECGEEIALKWCPSSPGGTCFYGGLASVSMVRRFFHWKSFVLVRKRLFFPQVSTSARHHTSVRERNLWTASTGLGITLTTTGGWQTDVGFPVSSALTADFVTTGTSASSLTVRWSCWPPPRTLRPLFLTCVQKTPGIFSF